MFLSNFTLIEVCGVIYNDALFTFPNIYLDTYYHWLLSSALFIRSPWSNKYEPPIEDGAMPSSRLRKLEVEANNAFDQYRDLWVPAEKISLWDFSKRRESPSCDLMSVFFKVLWGWCVLRVPLGLGTWLRWSYSHQEGWGWIQKDQRVLGLHPCGGGAGENQLIWNRLTFKTCSCQVFLLAWLGFIHIGNRECVQLSTNIGVKFSLEYCLIACLLCEQEKSSGRTAHYKLTSTVMLWLQTNKEGSGTMNLGGSLTRQVQCWTELKKTTSADTSSLSVVIRKLVVSCFHRWKKMTQLESPHPTSPTSAALLKSVYPRISCSCT